ncbi:hypothetical protein IWQ62_002077 [Dispira parvispora]|uniref:Uncharacterized protein n=1 Tax=Dispira parvispora TaxID=1520584 RepID=A0A9W8E483_9FUNG|nr:hypothetical protein IWQ62_002077 [Dispira parvispora]
MGSEMDPGFISNAEVVQLLVPEFDGKADKPTWQSWKGECLEVIDSFLPDVAPEKKIAQACLRLHPSIQDEIRGLTLQTLEDLDVYMEDRFPLNDRTKYYHLGVYTKSLFAGQSFSRLKMLALEAYNHLGQTDYWAVTILEALVIACKEDLATATNDIWDCEKVTTTTFHEHLDKVIDQVWSGRKRAIMVAGMETKHPFMVAPASSTQPLPQETKPQGPRNGSNHTTIGKPKGNKKPSLAVQIQNLKKEIDNLKARKSGGMPKELVMTSMETTTFVIQSKHWRYLQGATVGKVNVEAAADQGAAISLMTLTAAKRLGLRINPIKRPKLQPCWGNSPLEIVGIANALFTTEETSRKRWIRVLVTQEALYVELLVGKPDLDRIDLDLKEAPNDPTPLPLQSSLYANVN